MKTLVEKPVEPAETKWVVNPELCNTTHHGNSYTAHLQFPDDTCCMMEVGSWYADGKLMSWLTAHVEVAIKQDREMRRPNEREYKALLAGLGRMEVEYDKLAAENKQQQVRCEAQAHNYRVLSDENDKLKADYKGLANLVARLHLAAEDDYRGAK